LVGTFSEFSQNSFGKKKVAACLFSKRAVKI
jgi:hypothetical protein